MNFFFDENLSERLARAMCLLDEECSVIHAKDKSLLGAEDQVILDYVGKNELFFITRDKKISKRPGELSALRRHGVGAYILTGKKVGRWKGIRQLILAWEEVRSTASRTPKPFIFKISITGRLKQI